MLKDFVWSRPKVISQRTNDLFKFEYVSNIWIKKQLQNLKRNKATGPDGLPPGLLKDCAAEITSPLRHIINMSLSTSTVPIVWKQSKILPAHKSGPKNQPENYRLISILPILSKVLEKAVHLQLLKFLEDRKLLTKYQFGYRSTRSTQLATTLLIDDIRREVDDKKLVGVVFIDLSRAFNTINHSALLNKLS